MLGRRLFLTRDRQNLWDDSSDEDETNHPPVIETVDLSRSPEPTTSSLPSGLMQEQQTMPSYIPSTLQQDSRRYSILPAFPTSFYNDQPPLLLANVPGRQSDVYRTIEIHFLFFKISF